MASEVQAFRKLKVQAEEGSLVIEQMILHQDYILKDIRDEMTTRRSALQSKVSRMEGIRHRLDAKIDVNNLEHVALLKKLWEGLLPIEDDAEDTFVGCCNENDIDVRALLASSRWLKSGFHTKDPLGGFRGGGLLSLECLTFFVHEYKDKAQVQMKSIIYPVFL